MGRKPENIIQQQQQQEMAFFVGKAKKLEQSSNLPLCGCREKLSKKLEIASRMRCKGEYCDNLQSPAFGSWNCTELGRHCREMHQTSLRLMLTFLIGFRYRFVAFQSYTKTSQNLQSTREKKSQPKRNNRILVSIFLFFPVNGRRNIMGQ